MNNDYEKDLYSLVMERLHDICKSCPNAKRCHDNCTEYECDNYQELEREISETL